MRPEELEHIAPGVRGGHAEGLLESLGALEVRSMDIGHFGGATDDHDLNLPLDESLNERFTAVIDGGTLEHVFNAPEALRSAMRMVECSGHLIMIAPCNNAPGHAFYQFT